ncbi:hypothetical protein TNCV_2414191 [Trichonephila clavipes]|nr:hypothetical protein TNCV_2414191 [Trichonephila clavipes]
MGERAFDVSLGWEVQGRNAICDWRGTLSNGRAARLPLGGRSEEKGELAERKIFSRERYEEILKFRKIFEF